MDGSVEGLGTATMRARRVAQARISHEEACNDEGHTEDAQEEWSPDGAPACSKDLPEPKGEAEREQPTDQEVGDLHPPAWTQAEAASIIVPCVVAGASGTLYQ